MPKACRRRVAFLCRFDAAARWRRRTDSLHRALGWLRNAQTDRVCLLFVRDEVPQAGAETFSSSRPSSDDGELPAGGRAARERAAASKLLPGASALAMTEASSTFRVEHTTASRADLSRWGLTFELRRGAKGAKRPL